MNQGRPKGWPPTADAGAQLVAIHQAEVATGSLLARPRGLHLTYSGMYAELAEGLPSLLKYKVVPSVRSHAALADFDSFTSLVCLGFCTHWFSFLSVYSISSMVLFAFYLFFRCFSPVILFFNGFLRLFIGFHRIFLCVSSVSLFPFSAFSSLVFFDFLFS